MRAQFHHPMQAGLSLVWACVAAALFGCGDPTRSAEPSVASSDNSSSLAAGALPVRQVIMMDACDPTTFNAAIGPGTCVGRQGGVTFDKFIAQLVRNQKAGAWHNAPPNMTAREGQTLRAINQGGEVHTFTRVTAYGGGIVPDLNQLLGNPPIADGCTTLVPGDFIPPGGTDDAVVEGASVQRFMCCIHPWMRTTVRTR